MFHQKSIGRISLISVQMMVSNSTPTGTSASLLPVLGARSEAIVLHFTGRDVHGGQVMLNTPVLNNVFFEEKFGTGTVARGRQRGGRIGRDERLFRFRRDEARIGIHRWTGLEENVIGLLLLVQAAILWMVVFWRAAVLFGEQSKQCGGQLLVTDAEEGEEEEAEQGVERGEEAGCREAGDGQVEDGQGTTAAKEDAQDAHSDQFGPGGAEKKTIRIKIEIMPNLKLT